MLDWDVFVRVDSTVYSIFGSSLLSLPGAPSIVNLTSENVTLANITNTVVTPTQTVLSTTAGPMEVNLTFLNPVEVHLNGLILLNPTLTSLLSQEIGSSNRYRSRTFLSRRHR